MERSELVRRVTLLQACVRGRQTRRRLQSLRAEYEEVVRQVEGGLGGPLRWAGRWLPRPVFSPDPRRSTCGPGEGGGDCPGREPPNKPGGEEPERDGGWKEPCPVKGPEQGAGRGPEAGNEEPTRNPEALELTLPSQPAQLQRLRRHLAMEMLWLQQAIVSRKKYLLLRQTLDLPED